MSIMGRMLQYRGAEQDFDADKMLPGMFAVSTDKKYVRMCFSPGVVERIALYEAFEEDMKQIQLILATCEDIQVAVEAFNDLGRQYAEKAESEADRARNEADEAEACAIRAEEAAARAEAVTDIGIATADKAGIIKANADEFAVSLDGKLSLTSSYEEQESLEEITGTESKKTLFGKLAKAIEEFKTHIGNNNIHYTLSNNLLATVAGTALDAVQGKNLDNRITELNRNLDNLIKVKTLIQTVKMPAGTSTVNFNPEIPSGGIMIAITSIVANTHIQTSVRNAVRSGININLYNAGTEVTTDIRLDIAYIV